MKSFVCFFVCLINFFSLFLFFLLKKRARRLALTIGCGNVVAWLIMATITVVTTEELVVVEVNVLVEM